MLPSIGRNRRRLVNPFAFICIFLTGSFTLFAALSRSKTLLDQLAIDQDFQGLKREFDAYDQHLLFGGQQQATKTNDADDDQTLDDQYIADWEQDDPRLIEHIRKRYLWPPAGWDVPYNLSSPDKVDYSLHEASSIANNTFGGKKNGFFVECGAYDGEDSSNSLMFERHLNWTGLLVEPEPDNFRTLRTKGRKSWLVNGCIHGFTRPKVNVIIGPNEVSILESYVDSWRKLYNGYLALLIRNDVISTAVKSTRVWCFPLYSLLRAINVTWIDYLVLDVEGGELDVLKNLLLTKDQLHVTLMQIEYTKFETVGKSMDLKKGAALRDFMTANYPEYTKILQTYMDSFYLLQDSVRV